METSLLQDDVVMESTTPHDTLNNLKTLVQKNC